MRTPSNRLIFNPFALSLPKPVLSLSKDGRVKNQDLSSHSSFDKLRTNGLMRLVRMD
jgi:hypothetical protein